MGRTRTFTESWTGAGNLSVTGTPAGRGGAGQSVRDARPVSFWARITNRVSANRYGFIRIDEGAAPGFGDLTDAPEFGDGTNLAAYEVTGSTTVPVGAKVRLWPGGVDDTPWYTFKVESSLSTWKNECLVATTGNITLSGLQTIDGVPVPAGRRVMVRAQTTATQNGVYVSSAGTWTRATDLDDAGDTDAGYVIFVSAGDTYSGTIWRLNGSITNPPMGFTLVAPETVNNFSSTVVPPPVALNANIVTNNFRARQQSGLYFGQYSSPSRDAMIEGYDAAYAQKGMVSTTAQTFGGVKTVQDGLNVGGNGLIGLSYRVPDATQPVADTVSNGQIRTLSQVIYPANYTPGSGSNGVYMFVRPGYSLPFLAMGQGDVLQSEAWENNLGVQFQCGGNVNVVGFWRFGRNVATQVVDPSTFAINSGVYFKAAVNETMSVINGIVVPGGDGAPRVTSVSVASANGVSGSSSGGASPVLTLSMGNITPGSVNTGGGAISGGPISGSTGSFTGAVSATSFNGLVDGGAW